MSESNMWKALKPLFEDNGLDAHRIENKIELGTPDVNYLHGWIELKYKSKWPARGGILALPHFTALQRRWLDRRHTAGGRAFVLLKVNKEWILFEGATGSKVLGHLRKEELLTHALICTTNKNKLLDYL